MKNESESNEKNAILGVVNRLKDAWLQKQYDAIGKCVADDAIVAPLGSPKRIQGREAYVQSYRDYDAIAETQEFDAEEPQIDIIGNTAVAVTPFAITYKLQDTLYRERGKDILVLARESGEWRVVWRTMQSEPAVQTND